MTRLKRQAAHARGVEAEQHCARWLETQGYTIHALRLRNAGGEIDLIASTADTLVFVEVKARVSITNALESITPTKCARLAQAAEAVLAAPESAGLAHPLPPNIRFDVIAVPPSGEPHHLIDAWRLS